jgi:hypothetical protein
MRERRDLPWLRFPAPDRESRAFVTATATRLPDLQAEATRPRRTDAVTLLSISLFLLMAIPSPLAFSPLGGAGSPDILFGVVLLVAYLTTLAAPHLALSRGRQPIRTAGVVLTCAVLCSYISANRRVLPSLEANAADRGVIIILGWLGVLLVAADGIPSMDRLRTMLGRITVGGTGLSILAIVQFFTGLNPANYIQIPGLSASSSYTSLLVRNDINRPSATAIDPIELACVLAICLPIALHRARYAPPDQRFRRWLQVALIGLAIPMTVSRTGIIAIVVVALVMLPVWPKRDRRLAYLFGGIGALAVYVTARGLTGELLSLFGQVGSDTSSASRTSAFSSAVPFINQHPWLGRGFGTFLPATYFFTDDQYLLSFIEIGAIGVLCLLGLFVTGWMTARNARRRSVNPQTRDLAQSMAAAVAVPMVAFVTFDAFSFPMAAGLTFLMLGCVGALWRLVRTDETASVGAVPAAGPPSSPMVDDPLNDTAPIPVISGY